MAAGVGVAGWLWLVVFNAGRLALPDAEVRLDSDGFRYIHLDKVSTVPWSEYRGYRLTWEFPRRLRIDRLKGRPVIVELSAFSRDQRAILLTTLTARHGAA
jgi:hypothetical protein